jgi:hypothetical protein
MSGEPGQPHLLISGAKEAGSYVATVDLNGAADGGTVTITAQRTWDRWSCVALLVLGAVLASILSLLGGRIVGALAAKGDRERLKERLDAAQQKLVEALKRANFGQPARDGWSANPGTIWTEVNGLPGFWKALVARVENWPGGETFEKARTDVAAYETAAATALRTTLAYTKLKDLAPRAVFTQVIAGFLEQGAAPAGAGFEAAPTDLDKVDDTAGHSANALSRIRELDAAIDASSLPPDDKRTLKAALVAAKYALETNTDSTKFPTPNPWIAIGAATSALTSAPPAARALVPTGVPAPHAPPDLADAIARARDAARRASALSIGVSLLVAAASAVVAVLIGLTTTYYSAATWGTGSDQLKAFVWAFSLAGGLQVAGYFGFSPPKKV